MSNQYTRLPWPERFWAKVEKTDTCWVWRGARRSVRPGESGYGSVVFNGKQIAAHRWSYEDAKGQIPEGMVIDHLCRTSLCVRPDHLEAVSNRENILRGSGPTAVNARKTICKNGHPLEGNTYRQGTHGRVCKTCWNRASNERKRRKRAAKLAAQA